ncbi:MAG: acetylxylan esterase [Lentisphaeria bacterium]|nr:acetylxylan esterase [Lentisphaeria bacterium]
MSLSAYEKLGPAFAASQASQNAPIPVTPEAKAEIRRRLFRMMRVKESWLPEIRWKTLNRRTFDEVETETLRFRSWDGVYGDATLYLPRQRQGKVPAMLFSPGHAMAQGRFSGNYQIMCQLLAAHGTAALLFDQFGQGDRVHTGHNCYEPFTCGTSVIGLMILEGVALFNALASDERIDPDRIGIMGQSGGGQNTIFLSAALQERSALAVVSGWTGSFEFTARKERKLCACDLFPGIIHEFELWHAVGCLYPHPVMCCSGFSDPLFGWDAALQLKHRLESFYAPGKSEVYLWAGCHKWNSAECFAHIADFILRNYGLPVYGATLKEIPQPFFPEGPVPDKPPYPDDAVNLAELAARLTGKAYRQVKSITEIFPKPAFLTQQEFDSLNEEEKEYFVQAASFL